MERTTQREKLQGAQSRGRSRLSMAEMTPRTTQQQVSATTTTNPDPLLTEKQAAAYLGYSPKTLAGWRYKGGGPVFVRTSPTSVRYRVSDLEAWIAARRRKSTSDPGEEDEADDT